MPTRRCSAVGHLGGAPWSFGRSAQDSGSLPGLVSVGERCFLPLLPHSGWGDPRVIKSLRKSPIVAIRQHRPWGGAGRTYAHSVHARLPRTTPFFYFHAACRRAAAKSRWRAKQNRCCRACCTGQTPWERLVLHNQKWSSVLAVSAHRVRRSRSRLRHM
jgi:hypothetical protein